MDRTIAQKCISVTCAFFVVFSAIPGPHLFAASDRDSGNASNSPMDYSQPAAQSSDKASKRATPVNPYMQADPRTSSASAAANAHAVDLAGAAQPDQSIMAGDFLYFSVSPAEELSRDLVVDQDGKISVPLIGSVQASGLTTDELSRKIVRALSRYVTSPKVDIYLRQSISKQIGVTGQVTFPGTHPYQNNMHLLDVITLAGGFLPTANQRMVHIMRRTGVDRKVIRVNVEEILAGGSSTKDVLLEPGDLIEVPRGMTGVSIFGSVAGPGIYDYVDEMRMLDLISMAHGLSEGAALRHIRVIRGSGPNQRTITVSFNKVIKDHNKDKANILMEPGDIVYVPQKALWSASALANTISPIAAVIMAGAAVALATKK